MKLTFGRKSELFGVSCLCGMLNGVRTHLTTNDIRPKVLAWRLEIDRGLLL